MHAQRFAIAAILRDAGTDLRLAARGHRQRPALGLMAGMLLALGIGANCAIFSLINAVLLRALPVRDPGRLVLLFVARPDGTSHYMIPQPVYRQLGERNQVLDGLAAATFPPLTLAVGGAAEHVGGLLVSGNFYQTLGVPAALGRVLAPADDRLPVCVISFGLWQRRFGGDPGVIGRQILLNAHPFTVVGVTPRTFLGLAEDSPLDIGIPLRAAGMSAFFQFPVRTFGRLRPGVSAARAQASLDVLYHQVAGPSRGSSDTRVVLQDGSHGFSALRKQYRTPLLMAQVMVGLVLLIACANVANLLLARTAGRAKEIAVRLALGAGRRRLTRQFLAETALLAGAGSAGGIAMAYALDRALLAMVPRSPGGGELNFAVYPDWRVLLFTAAIAVVVTLLSGLAPARRAARLAAGPALKGASGAPGRMSWGRALVVAQVALSLVLLIGAGLFLRSLHNLRSVDPGLNPEHLTVLTLDPGTSGYSSAASIRLAEELVQRARELPAVQAASAAFVSPFSGGIAWTDLEVRGARPPRVADSIDVNWIGAQYFQVLGTPFAAGRAFSDQDGRANHVAIVNRTAARIFWPGESPVGRHALVGGEDCEIVGVVADVRSASLRDEAKPAVYLPFARNTRPHFVLHVRVAGPAEAMVPPLLREVRALAPDVAPFDATTMAAQLARTLALDRLMALLTALFGCLAVIMAAAGLYGLMSLSVAARTREIGIRMALGAGSARVLADALRECAFLALAGIALGLPAAWWATRFAAAFLFGLRPGDPATFLETAALLAITAAAAAWLPARRAARVDPAISLRHE